MQYVDTSVLVAALTNQRDTAHMQSWLARQPGGNLVVSEWVAAEFSAALSIKLRTVRSKPGTGPMRSPGSRSFVWRVSGRWRLPPWNSVRPRPMQIGMRLACERAMHCTSPSAPVMEQGSVRSTVA
jgi:hypothetical protein